MQVVSLMELMENSQYISWEGYLCLVFLGNDTYKLWVGKYKLWAGRCG